MKRIVLIWAALAICIFCFAKNGASIEFATKAHDFGVVSEESKTATYNFVFKNTGNAPIIIYKAIASCGCTTPIFPKEPIAAGATAAVKVTYDTEGRPGAFHKEITVYTNDAERPNLILIITGTVEPKTENIEATYPKNIQGLRLTRTSVPFLNAKIGSTETETINIINTNGIPVKLSFSKVPRHIIVSPKNLTLQPDETGKLAIQYLSAEAHDYGRREDAFYIVINGKKISSNNRINVSAYIAEDFSHQNSKERENAPVAEFSLNRINYGKMEAKTHKTAYIQLSNKGRSPLYIRKIIPEYDGIKILAEKKKLQAGESEKVKIDFNAGTFNGNIVQRISFITNDPKNSLIRILATAQVSKK